MHKRRRNNEPIAIGPLQLENRRRRTLKKTIFQKFKRLVGKLLLKNE